MSFFSFVHPGFLFSVFFPHWRYHISIFFKLTTVRITKVIQNRTMVDLQCIRGSSKLLFEFFFFLHYQVLEDQQRGLRRIQGSAKLLKGEQIIATTPSWRAFLAELLLCQHVHRDKMTRHMNKVYATAVVVFCTTVGKG